MAFQRGTDNCIFLQLLLLVTLMQQLTRSSVLAMYEHGALSPSVWERRHTLLALCELAARAKGAHDPASRARLRRFRAMLEAMEGNDEIEVTGETICETVMLAAAAFDKR